MLRTMRVLVAMLGILALPGCSQDLDRERPPPSAEDLAEAETGEEEASDEDAGSETTTENAGSQAADTDGQTTPSGQGDGLPEMPLLVIGAAGEC